MRQTSNRIQKIRRYSWHVDLLYACNQRVLLPYIFSSLSLPCFIYKITFYSRSPMKCYYKIKFARKFLIIFSSQLYYPIITIAFVAIKIFTIKSSMFIS